MLDGANAWQRLIRVTVPVIRPVIEVVFILGFIFTVKVFDVVIGLTQGGPANTTQILAPWAYNLSFQQFNYGAGAALNTVCCSSPCSPRGLRPGWCGLRLLLRRGEQQREDHHHRARLLHLQWCQHGRELVQPQFEKSHPNITVNREVVPSRT